MQNFYSCGEMQEIQHLTPSTFNLKTMCIVMLHKIHNSMTPHLYLL